MRHEISSAKDKAYAHVRSYMTLDDIVQCIVHWITISLLVSAMLKRLDPFLKQFASIVDEVPEFLLR